MAYVSKHYADNLSMEKDETIIAPAADRNKEPIFDVVKSYLKSTAHVFEVASGPGQHVSFFAKHLPHVTWQPSDIDDQFLRSISSFIAKESLTNVKQPMHVDITKPVSSYSNLKPKSFDMILNINMIHISPWETSVGIFKFAGHLLKKDGVLLFYGPFKVDGILAAESNVIFDQRLRSQDPRWGIRDTRDLEELANENGLKFENMVDLPANNKCRMYQKFSDN